MIFLVQLFPGGFMIPEAEIHRSKIREDILEANRYAVSQIDEFKLDLLDLHYHFFNQLHRRCKDGIHWDATGKFQFLTVIAHC